MTLRLHFRPAALPLLLLLGAWLLGTPAATLAQAPSAKAARDTASSAPTNRERCEASAPGAEVLLGCEARAVPAWDRQALLAVYRADGPVVTPVMRTADAAAYPLFFGAPAVVWGAALLRGTDYGDAYRLTLSEGLALGAALGLKKVFGRSRPYRTLPEVRSRSERYRRGQEGRFAEAFPSGHAAVSFALAVSWSLSHPDWYVAAPAFAGATILSASRLWLGVHYPSDVLAGALLGTAAAVGVHLLRGALTPGALEDRVASSKGAASAPSVTLRFPLP